jgi:hypothetical protein
MSMKPYFIIRTGDITHLSKPEEFDNADQIYGETGLQLHYVPGEHDMIDEGQGKAYIDRYGKSTQGAGWYSFDDHGVHFIGLVNGWRHVCSEQAGQQHGDLSLVAAVFLTEQRDQIALFEPDTDKDVGRRHCRE